MCFDTTSESIPIFGFHSRTARNPNWRPGRAVVSHAHETAAPDRASEAWPHQVQRIGGSQLTGEKE
jgi:hypothetical protein